MNIQINVVNQCMKLASPLCCIVEGSQQFVKFKFNFTEEWKELKIFAQFKQGSKAYNQFLDAENCVYLPTEIQEGECILILYGSLNKTIATTNYLTFKISKNLLISDAQSTEISESLYNQLVNQIETVPEMIKKAEKAVTDANNATDRANTAAEKAESIANDVDTKILNALKNTKKYYDLVLPSNDGDSALGNFPFFVEHNGKRIEAFTINTDGREPTGSSGYAEVECYIAVYYLEDNNKIPVFKNFTPTDIENISFVIKGKPEDPIGFTEDVIYDWNLLISLAEAILPHKITASTNYEEQIYPYDNYGVYKLSIRADNITTKEEYTNFAVNFALQISLIAARAKDITITWSKYDADKSDVALSDGFTQVTKTREMI